MIVYTNKHHIPFQIDEDDYESVSNYFWHIGGNDYLLTNVYKYFQGYNIGRTSLTLHVFLMGPAPKGLMWDHEDRDKMNNQRYNFRLVTNSVNIKNRNPIHSKNSTGVQGISKAHYRDGTRYYRVRFRGRLGSYISFEEACKVLQEAQDKLR